MPRWYFEDSSWFVLSFLIRLYYKLSFDSQTRRFKASWGVVSYQQKHPINFQNFSPYPLLSSFSSFPYLSMSKITLADYSKIVTVTLPVKWGLLPHILLLVLLLGLCSSTCTTFCAYTRPRMVVWLDQRSCLQSLWSHSSEPAPPSCAAVCWAEVVWKGCMFEVVLLEWIYQNYNAPLGDGEQSIWDHLSYPLAVKKVTFGSVAYSHTIQNSSIFS